MPWLPSTRTLHTSRVINSRAPEKLLLKTSPQHLTCSESAVLPFTSFWAHDSFRFSFLTSQCILSSTQSNFSPDITGKFGPQLYTLCRKVFQGTSSLVELQLCTNIPVNHPNYLKILLFLQYLKNPTILSKQPRMSQAAEFPSNFLQLGSGTGGSWTQTPLVQPKCCKNELCATVPACSRLCPKATFHLQGLLCPFPAGG